MRKVFELETIETAHRIPIDIIKHKLIITDDYAERIFEGIVDEREDIDSPIWDKNVNRKILELIVKKKIECIDLNNVYRYNKKETTESIYEVTICATYNNISFTFMSLTDARAVYVILKEWLIHDPK